MEVFGAFLIYFLVRKPIPKGGPESERGHRQAPLATSATRGVRVVPCARSLLVPRSRCSRAARRAASPCSQTRHGTGVCVSASREMQNRGAAGPGAAPTAAPARRRSGAGLGWAGPGGAAPPSIPPSIPSLPFLRPPRRGRAVRDRAWPGHPCPRSCPLPPALARHFLCFVFTSRFKPCSGSDRRRCLRREREVRGAAGWGTPLRCGAVPSPPRAEPPASSLAGVPGAADGRRVPEQHPRVPAGLRCFPAPGGESGLGAPGSVPGAGGFSPSLCARGRR